MSDDLNHSPNPHRLYRDKEKGIIGGVCAGLAEYAGFDTSLVRFAVIISLLFFFPITVLGYVIAWAVIPKRPAYRNSVSSEEGVFWQGITHNPKTLLSNIHYHFRQMDKRLQKMERLTTSEEWRLRRQFRELEDEKT